ncbi:hypothetical protein [Hydrogenovibrio kuenenii]|uniref:hypothetical protein n=1 Tax=Hydrogenovibrio kuenenii TaxID=63658 RepID=UPI00046681B7|nr:hypothetical protein [Hydrogenovibrio kuenenii]
MKLNLADNLFRQYVQKPAFILLILLLGFGGLNYGLFQYQKGLQHDNNLSERHLKNLLKQIKFLRSQAQLFHSYGEKYQTFLNEGLVYQQDRVKWTDELLKIKTQLNLVPFNFQFDAERQLVKSDVAHLKLNKNIFYYTQLHLTMGLVSDLDLLRVLERIHKHITPLFLVKGCEIIAHNEVLQKPKFTPNTSLFDAKCTLILFQAKPKPFRLEEN